MNLVAGSIVAGRFRLGKPLAKGGMGEVWIATDLSLDVPVAMKFMSQAALGSPELVARFEMEAKAAAKLRHPHVVQILAHGLDRGVPFIAMELLEGEDLGARLKARGRLPITTTARILRDVCKPIEKAHAMKLVHRDLKPANIFLCKHDDYELVKVLDFGIAKSVAEAAAVLTKSGAIVGSPQYMSPEQARRTSEKVDHRSDLWALGVIAFRALTGQVPFSGAMLDVLMSVLNDPVPRPSSIARDLGPDVDAFFARALARDPDSRFQSAKELGDALATLAGLPPEDAQTALHRSLSEEKPPPPRAPDRAEVRAPPPRASDPSAATHAASAVTIAGGLEDPDFDNAKTMPIGTSAAQRAITGKPWTTSARSVESTVVDPVSPRAPASGSPSLGAVPPAGRTGAESARVVLNIESPHSARPELQVGPPLDNRARPPLGSGSDPSFPATPVPNATSGGIGTLTSAGAEVRLSPAPPRRNKPWVLLVALGAAVVVVLVVIGAVLTTADTSDSASADEAATGILGTVGLGAPTSTAPGLLVPVKVSADGPPESAGPAPSSDRPADNAARGSPPSNLDPIPPPEPPIH